MDSDLYLAKITVKLRPSILDVQGKAVQHAVESLGMQSVREVRIGKAIEMKLECATQADAERTAEEACKKLLANPVMEDYWFNVEKI